MSSKILEFEIYKTVKYQYKSSGEISPTTNKIMNLLFSSFKGIRDDLEFLFEEDLSSINLCALHCELRNTEQLLSLLVFFCTKWVHLMNVMPNWQIMALRILAAE